ncbi:MAG: hypothetical protein JEZ08_23140 [Clostridiales bacterium]|nr:hypothetical protein [Clostridiales bacterium]
MHLEKLYNYENEIQHIIVGLMKIYDDDCDHIILYGSAAQNKLTYRRVNDKIEFFSDIEFFVVPKNAINENDKEFNKILMRKSYEFLKECHNLKTIPFVDVNSVSKSFFSEADLRISTFELKNNGTNLKGKNLLGLLPEINKNNYNPKVQNIEIIKGLKILLLESYNWFLSNEPHSKVDEEKFCYFLSSSFLNILRTLLPLVGGFKLSTEERVDLIDDETISEEISLYFSEDTLKQFKKVLNDKNSCDYSYSPSNLFSINYDGYKSMLCMLLVCSEEMLIVKIEENKNSVFHGSSEKVDQLIQLTKFFVFALDCIKRLIDGVDILDEEIIRLISSFDDLMECRSDDLSEGKNSFKLSTILNKYKELEKKRWRIIGSKD